MSPTRYRCAKSLTSHDQDVVWMWSGIQSESSDDDPGGGDHGGAGSRGCDHGGEIRPSLECTFEFFMIHLVW